MRHEVVRVLPERRDQAVDVLARAFALDPMYVALIPDPKKRQRAAALMFDGVLRYTLRFGEVWTTSNEWGVACWLPPGETDVTLWRMALTGFALPLGMRGFPRPAFGTMMRFFVRLDEERKRHVPDPHWYLWVLGVSPDRQGHGVGSALLRSVLSRADATRVPCYLETQTEPNVAFYRRRGFEVVSVVTVPEIDLPMWSMVRQPQL